MPDRFVETHIRQLPLFARLPPDQLRWAMDAFRVLRFEPGELVFAQGEPTQGLTLFVSGRAVLVRADPQGRQQQIGVIGPNQYLNEAALFKSGIETASLQVIERATVLFVPRRQLMTVVAHHPEMREYLPVPVVAQRDERREQVFQGQRPNETILLNTRRHWWAFVRKAWLPGIVGGSFLVLAGLIPVTLLQLSLCGLAFIVPGLIMVYFYLEWRNDQVILTNQRLIHIERTIHTLETHINEINFDSIHQVNADIVTSDPFSRIFRYGTVDIRTAGEAGNVKLTVIPDPDGIQDIILQNRVQREKQAERQHREEIRAAVDKALGGPVSAAQQPPGEPSRRESVYRKHVSFWVRGVIWPGMLLFFALAVFVLSLAAPGLRDLGVIGPVFAFFLFIIGALWFYWADWDWRNDLYIVDDDIITLIHKRPLFLQNHEDQILVNSIDNVASERKGLVQSLLDYGNVRISLIGGDIGDAKVFRGVSHPNQIQAEITLRQARMRSQEKQEAERRRQQEIADYISVYHETVGGQPGTPQPPGSPQSPISSQAAPPPAPRPPAPRDGMRPPRIPKQRGEG